MPINIFSSAAIVLLITAAGVIVYFHRAGRIRLPFLKGKAENTKVPAKEMPELKKLKNAKPKK